LGVRGGIVGSWTSGRVKRAGNTIACCSQARSIKRKFRSQEAGHPEEMIVGIVLRYLPAFSENSPLDYSLNCPGAQQPSETTDGPDKQHAMMVQPTFTNRRVQRQQERARTAYTSSGFR
jgi:hypothetical protein